MIPRNLAALRERADQPPTQARVPLRAAGCQFGSVSSALAAALRNADPPLLHPAGDADGALEVAVDLHHAQPAFHALALWLHRHGHAGAWRDEALAVRDDQGDPLGSIERGVVRPLGIATHAVHLVGTSADGRIWLQQRAHDKATDPGKWDTLMGGMIAAGESLEIATARETWEEAGIALRELGGFAALRDHGIVRFRRPVPDSGTDGYLVERIHVLSSVLPPPLQPNNQDGEVAHFELVSRQTLVEWVEADLLTLEASLVLACCLGW